MDQNNNSVDQLLRGFDLQYVAIEAEDSQLFGVFAEVAATRMQQDKQWGGPSHDDEHSNDDWFGFIGKQVNDHAKVQMQGITLGQKSLDKSARSRLLDIAALAIAGLESICRKTGCVPASLSEPTPYIGQRVTVIMPPDEKSKAYSNSGTVVEITETEVACSVLVDMPRTMRFSPPS